MAVIGNSLAPYFTAVSTDVFSANGTGNTFSLSRNISNLGDIEVIVNNIQQNPYSGSYSVSGNTLTFSEAPLSGSNNVVVTYRQATLGSTIPTPNTVGNNALQRDLSLTGNTTTQHLVPAANITYDIGTSTMRYRDLYLSGNTINLGDIKLSTNGTSFSVANATGGVFASALGNTVITGTLTSNATTITGNVTITGTATVNGVVTFANSTSNVVIIAANGNIGINDSSPATRLRIVENEPQRGIVHHVVNGANTPTTGALIQLTQNNIEDWAIGCIPANTGFGIWRGRHKNADGTQIITIANTGYVGINNTTPSYMLTVAGSAILLPNSNFYHESTYGGGGWRFNTKASLSSGPAEEKYVYSTGATTGSNELTYQAHGVLAGNTQVGYWNLQTKSGSSWNNFIMVYDSKMGLGTTSPGHTLDVNGTINVSNSYSYKQGGVYVINTVTTANTNVWTEFGSGLCGHLNGNDIRSPNPGNFPRHGGEFLFTSYDLASGAPYGDAIHINSYNDSSGGDPNILVINKGTNGVKVARGGWASYYTPSSTGYASGSVYTLNYTSASDASVKEDVQNITNGLDVILQLRPVTYKWTDEYILAGFSKNSEEKVFEEGRLVAPTVKVDNVGLIAQEVQQILPTVVHNDNVSLPGTENYLLNVSYEKLVPHLIAAVKEQQALIDALTQRISALENI